MTGDTKGKAGELPPFFPSHTRLVQPSNAAVAEKEGKGGKVALGRRGLDLDKGPQPCGSAAPHRGLLRRNALASADCKAVQAEPGAKQEADLACCHIWASG